MSFTVKAAVGDGVLGRFGGSLVLAPSDSLLVDAVLELAREADRDHPSAPGRHLPRKVAGLVAQSDDVPTLAVVSCFEDGLAVLLVGDVTMTLTDEGGTSTQSGRDATTWVDRVVRGPWSGLVLSLSGAGPVDRRSDLQGGVMTAAGAELRPAGAALVAASPVEQEPETVLYLEVPPVTAQEAPSFQSFALDEPVEVTPLPVVSAPGSEARSTARTAPGAPEPTVAKDAAGADVVVVQGIECSRQHFNDPTSIYCAVCGISMVHQTHNLLPGPRPPLGVIVLDDGAVFTLAGDYVLGREPDHAEEVLAGTATALALDDPDVTMSRVHARVTLVGWDVRLEDAGSANGTYTAKPGETEWTKLGTGESVILKPGSKVSLGGRTLVFDSHHKL
jgi:hypothetical protein